MYSFQERLNQFLVVLIFAVAFTYLGMLLGEWNYQRLNPCPTLPELRSIPQKQRETIKAPRYTAVDRSENIY